MRSEDLLRRAMNPHRRRTRHAFRLGLAAWLAAWSVTAGPGVVGPASAEPPVPSSPVRARPGVIHVFDARPLRALDVREPAGARQVWDTLHALAALQGLVNRDAPRLYLLYCSEFGTETDAFWLDWLRGEDGWLKGAEVRTLGSVDAVFEAFRTNCHGLVVYDPAVPATSAVASTVAGCEGLMPARYDPAAGSWFRRATESLGLPVRRWLVNPDGTSKFTGRGTVPDTTEPSSGSAKVDAYRWALARYLQPGGCDPRYGAYYLDAFWLARPANAPPDNHNLVNHDFFVARRAFFFDLSPWGDEAPVDDPGQVLGADRRTLLDVLRGLAEGSGGEIVRIGGFPPWPFKYTTHGKAGRHEGVPTEWEFTRLISQFNAFKEADAASLGAMANASFFQHYPLAARYRQPSPVPDMAAWKTRGFITADGQVAPKFFVGHYVGDYDAPSWLYKAVAGFSRDPDRGRVPLGWAFNPNLADRAPQAFVYAYRHATTNDFFIAGDSGAGYLNVRALSVRPDSGLPSGLAAWAEHCRRYYDRWGMTITGFVLDGSAGAATELEFGVYRGFSPDGLGTHFEAGPAMRAGIATCPEQDLPDRAEAAAKVIRDRARAAAGRPGFLWARSILKPPAWYAEVSRRLRPSAPDDPGIEVVDPYTFFGLIRAELSRP